MIYLVRRCFEVIFAIGLVSACTSDSHYDPREAAAATDFMIAPVRPLRISPDRTQMLLFVQSRSGALLRVTDLSGSEVVGEYVFDKPQPLPTVAWSPDGRNILFIERADRGYELRVWDFATGEIVVPLATTSKNIHGQQWASDGSRILYFVHPLDDPRSWRDGGRALYWVDPNGVQDQELILPELGQSYHKALSYDDQLAVLFPELGNLLAIHAREGEVNRFRLDSSYEVGQIAWSGNESILMSVRRPDEEFYGIDELNLVDGSVQRIASETWDLSAAAYLWDRTALLHVVNVDGLRRTRVCTIPFGVDCWWVGPDNVASSVLSTDFAGDSAIVLISGPLEPPSLHTASLRTGASVPLFVPENSFEVPPAGGNPLSVRSSNGFRIPAYYWAGEEIAGMEPAALIHVPGGPGLQGVPLWEPYVSYLTSRGIDVVYMNYEGQTGYGASYEKADGGIRSRAAEVLEIRDYLNRELGIPFERIVLYGHSYGAPIVMYATAQERITGPMILASVLGIDAGVAVEQHERCVVAFHGDADLILSPQMASENITRIFGESSLDEPCGHFEVFPYEGHDFELASSFGSVFATAVSMLGQ